MKIYKIIVQPRKSSGSYLDCFWHFSLVWFWEVPLKALSPVLYLSCMHTKKDTWIFSFFSTTDVVSFSSQCAQCKAFFPTQKFLKEFFFSKCMRKTLRRRRQSWEKRLLPFYCFISLPVLKVSKKLPKRLPFPLRDQTYLPLHSFPRDNFLLEMLPETDEKKRHTKWKWKLHLSTTQCIIHA